MNLSPIGNIKTSSEIYTPIDTVRLVIFDIHGNGNKLNRLEIHHKLHIERIHNNMMHDIELISRLVSSLNRADLISNRKTCEK